MPRPDVIADGESEILILGDPPYPEVYCHVVGAYGLHLLLPRFSPITVTADQGLSDDEVAKSYVSVLIRYLTATLHIYEPFGVGLLAQRRIEFLDGSVEGNRESLARHAGSRHFTEFPGRRMRPGS